MGEQSAARLEGDTYQHLYSWYLILELLEPSSRIDSIWLENAEAGSVDDVTVHPKNSAQAPRYYQVKWHRSLRKHYSPESLIDRSQGTSSLLERFWKTWKHLNAPATELWLVSNWAADSQLGEVIHGRDHALDPSLVTAGSRSASGKIRTLWQDHLHASDSDMEAFLRSLRFQLGFVSIRQLEVMVDDRMGRLGLLAGDQARDGAVGLIRRLIEVGGIQKKITVETLRHAIDERGLWNPKPTFPPRPVDPTLHQRYIQCLKENHRILKFQGILQLNQPIVLPLTDVYVAMSGNIPTAPKGSTRHHRDHTLSTDHDHKQQPVEDSQSKRISLTEALATYPTMVILGDPGAGKTTVLRYLALAFADDAAPDRLFLAESRLPILVSLAAYERVLGTTHQPLSTFLAHYYADYYDMPELAPLFEDALERGTAIVLLDGLDEVADSGLRNTVRQAVEVFIQRYGPHGNRIIVTSRKVGYHALALTPLPEITLCDFSLADIQTFTRQWCPAVAVAIEGDTPQIRLQATQMQRALMTAIQENPGVERLASNPLLLTILVLNYRQGTVLPRRRIELYDLYAKTLIDTWNQARSQGMRRIGPRLDVLKTIKVLAPLALWLHTSTAHGTARLREVQRELRRILTERGESNPDEAAEAWLHDIHHYTGLLIERGQDAWGFLHQTFQEYFAACALAMLSADKRWEMITPHLHDPRWHEVIRLTAGQLGVRNADEGAVTDLDRLTKPVGRVS